MGTDKPLYRIVNWDLNFETYESMRTVQACRWVAMPNKHDGKGFRRLMRESDAASIYGAWCLLVQLASKMPVRGVLCDFDGPLDSLDLEDKTGLSARCFERALEIAASDRVGWLRTVNDAAEAEEILSHIRELATPRSRKRPKAPAETPTVPQPSADSAQSPQIPADSAVPSQVPAYERAIPHDSAPRGRALADSTSHNSTEHNHTNGGLSEREVLEQTADFCIRVFGKKRSRLGDDSLRAIGQQSAALPLSPENQALLTWWIGLPPDPTDFELSRRHGDADSLAKNLFTALERAESYRKKNGARFSPQKKEAAPEPEGWRERFAKKYPRAVMPDAWSDLDGRLQLDLRADSKGAA